MSSDRVVECVYAGGVIYSVASFVGPTSAQRMSKGRQYQWIRFIDENLSLNVIERKDAGQVIPSRDWSNFLPNTSGCRQLGQTTVLLA